jgi:hypothetical protein
MRLATAKGQLQPSTKGTKILQYRRCEHAKAKKKAKYTKNITLKN